LATSIDTFLLQRKQEERCLLFANYQLSTADWLKITGNMHYLLLWSHFCTNKVKQIVEIMKQRIFSFCTAAVVVTLSACSNDGGTTSNTNDTATTTTNNSTVSTETTTATSAGSYAAMADSVERNSQQGYYLNPRTGKAYSNLKVDRTTGRITDEGGEPVWRYVDRRNWWVYGDNDMNDTMGNWGQIGTAKQEGEKIMYQGDGDKWVDYDTKWKKDDDGWKMKSGDTKIKVDKDGDIKIKEGDKKTKIDEDGVKQKN
jgi:hypothetical protein